MQPIRVSDGALEVLKWGALALMVFDHINKYLYGGQYKVIFYAGRICLPLFALILAYNLARPGALARGCHQRILTRLAIFGALAMPAFWMLGVPFFVLNIMFTLAVGVLCIWLLEEGGAFNKAIAWTAFLVLGAFVEFWWLGLWVMLAAWYFFKQPTALRGAMTILGVASLSIINRNLYALLALPIFYFAQYLSFAAPRYKYLFYGIYPVHLMALLGVKHYLM